MLIAGTVIDIKPNSWANVELELKKYENLEIHAFDKNKNMVIAVLEAPDREGLEAIREKVMLIPNVIDIAYQNFYFDGE